MILRIDRLAIELPSPAHPSPNSASAVQELLGGKFGETSASRKQGSTKRKACIR
jgi:Mn-containing catalase